MIIRAIKLCYDLTELCQRGKFRLTRWISNDRRVIENIRETERAASVKAIEGCIDMPIERALGVGWDIQRDHFTFTIKQRKPAHTRRQLLSIIAFLFDPLGFLAPFVVRAKILLQKVWQLGMTWDDPLPLDLLAQR